MAAPTPEAIENARRKVEQAKARLQALEARAATLNRKQDARRKIILGGLLLEPAIQDPAWESRQQPYICIFSPLCVFCDSGPVLLISLSERIGTGRPDARGYRKRPPQGRTGQGPVAGIGSARRHPEPQTGRPPQDHPRRPAPRCRDERPRMGIPPQ